MLAVVAGRLARPLTSSPASIDVLDLVDEMGASTRSSCLPARPQWDAPGRVVRSRTDVRALKVGIASRKNVAQIGFHGRSRIRGTERRKGLKNRCLFHRYPETPDEEEYAMAEVTKFQSSRLFQADEFAGWQWAGVASAGNFTGICAVPDPFDPVVDLCQVTEVWFSQPASGPPLTFFNTRKIRSSGGGMLFFVAALFVR